MIKIIAARYQNNKERDGGFYITILPEVEVYRRNGTIRVFVAWLFWFVEFRNV